MDLSKESQSDIDADIHLFEQMSFAKANFFDSLVTGRGAESDVNPRDLRQETIYQIAEFYYLLKVFGIDGPLELRSFGETHSEKIEELRRDTEEQERLGIFPQRLEDSLFDTEEKLDRLVAHSVEGSIRMSQSDIARFLIEYMSPETCRNGIKTLANAGYLNLSKSPFGSILVLSTGTLEQAFAKHIRLLRLNIKNAN